MDQVIELRAEGPIEREIRERGFKSSRVVVEQAMTGCPNSEENNNGHNRSTQF